MGVFEAAFENEQEAGERRLGAANAHVKGEPGDLARAEPANTFLAGLDLELKAFGCFTGKIFTSLRNEALDGESALQHLRCNPGANCVLIVKAAACDRAMP